MQVGNRQYRVRLGLTVFLVISVGSGLVAFFHAADADTWAGLKQIRAAYLVLAFALMVVQWGLNALRFKILVNSLDNHVGFMDSLKAFMANVFLSAITPSQTGGGPAQIYVLHRVGVPIAKGFAGCLMGAVLTVVSLVASTLIVLVARPSLRVQFGRLATGLLTSVVIAFIVLAGLFLVSVFKIGWMKQLTGRSVLVLTRMAGSQRRLGVTKRVLGGLDQYRECLSVFARTRKSRILAAFGITVAAIAVNALISLVLLSGLNVAYDRTDVYLAQFILLFIAYFGPTPGASGIAELTSYWVLSALNTQANMLGVYTVAWRFFTSFIGVGVGGLVILTLVPRREPDHAMNTTLRAGS